MESRKDRPDASAWQKTRREHMRRWAALPLREIVVALEEMGRTAEYLSGVAREEAPPRVVREGPDQDSMP